jgi:tetratricopeptide (TPR) repeat protein
MERSNDTKLTPDVAREICQRAGSKAYLAGAIASLGKAYVLGLTAVNCQSGDTLAQELITSDSKEKVVEALGSAASKIRGQLGESLATIQKFDVPLQEATTSSLEALKAFSLGMKIRNVRGPGGGLSYMQSAIRLDPNFAMAHEELGSEYQSMAEVGRSSQYITQAFQLRQHASEREKLVISGNYYRLVTGELNNAERVYEELIEDYPRGVGGYTSLGTVFGRMGQYERAAELMRQAQTVDPSNGAPYANLCEYEFALQHVGQALQTIHESQARHMDGLAYHNVLYALSFLNGDTSAMADQQKWFASKPEVENFGLALASDTEAFAGHLQKARELTQSSVEAAIKSDNKENGAVWWENAALREAAFGNHREARQAAARGLKLAPDAQSVKVEAALSFAMSDDTAQAKPIADGMRKQFPSATQVQSVWLPAIDAQIALDHGAPEEGLDVLHRALPPTEFALIPFANNLSCLYTAYIRGQADLAAGRGSAAAAEFQKILDHTGIVWNCWTGALAHLGVARANALQSRTSEGADSVAARVRALADYKDFLALWKDADPDIPILKQAKAEYAKLQ